MERGIIRNASLVLALVAGMGLGGIALVAQTPSIALADEAESGPVTRVGLTADASCADGTYTAQSKGIGGPFEVTVTVEGGAIVSVEVGENAETPDLGGQAIANLPDAIVAANGTDGVDSWSGASITSKAIFKAVEECIETAASGEGAVGAADDSAIEAAAQRQIKVAEGLEGADAEAVEQGLTVKIIDQYYDNLADALEVANQNGGGTITLLADTVATDDPEKVATLAFRTSVIFKSEGDEALTVYRAEGQTGPMLVMTDGTPNLKNVVFDCSGEGVTSPAIMISDQAVVKFNKEFVLQGNASDGTQFGADYGASAVSVSGADASLTLKEGATIKDCSGTGDAVAAIYNNGATVVNEGCVFEGNSADQGDNPNYAGTGKLKGDAIEG